MPCRLARSAPMSAPSLLTKWDISIHHSFTQLLMYPLVLNQVIASRWREIRQLGRRHFIIHVGIRQWAIPLGIFIWLSLFLVVPLFFQSETPNWQYLGSRSFWLGVVSNLVLWPIGGILWGMWEWRRQEARFARRNQ